MVNYFLLSAYVFTAGLLGFYGWSLAWRKAQLRRELDALTRKSPKS